MVYIFGAHDDGRAPAVAKTATSATAQMPAEVPAPCDDDNELRFARKLAANDDKKRRAAISGLGAWLKARSRASSEGTLPELELRKLWRGLFFCMWLADKAPVQSELAQNIAELVQCFSSTEGVNSWLLVCGRTLRGEWGRLDKYRVDKYYLLIRKIIKEVRLLNHIQITRTKIVWVKLIVCFLFLMNCADICLGQERKVGGCWSGWNFFARRILPPRAAQWYPPPCCGYSVRGTICGRTGYSHGGRYSFDSRAPFDRNRCNGG